MTVSVSGQEYDTDSFSPWFLQEETITLSLNEKMNDNDDNLVDTSLFTSWWFIALVVSSVLIIGFFLYKLGGKEDSYSISLDDEEDLEDQMFELDDESIEDTSFSDLEEIEASIITKEKVSSKSSPRTRSSSIRPDKQEQAPTTRKRRTRATKDDSTVIVSKRRRLVEDEVKPKVRKRRAVRQKVDIDDVEMSEELNRYEEN
jgi:hypothetical protein